MSPTKAHLYAHSSHGVLGIIAHDRMQILLNSVSTRCALPIINLLHLPITARDALPCRIGLGLAISISRPPQQPRPRFYPAVERIFPANAHTRHAATLGRAGCRSGGGGRSVHALPPHQWRALCSKRLNLLAFGFPGLRPLRKCRTAIALACACHSAGCFDGSCFETQRLV